MKRILLVLAVAALTAAMMAVMAAPAFAVPYQVGSQTGQNHGGQAAPKSGGSAFASCDAYWNVGVLPPPCI